MKYKLTVVVIILAALLVLALAAGADIGKDVGAFIYNITP